MKSKTRIPYCVILAILILPAAGSHAQTEKPNQPADLLREAADMALVVNDLEVVKSDINQLLDDVGLGGLKFFIEYALPLKPNSGLSLESGCIVYGIAWFADPVMEFQIADHDELCKTLDPPNNAMSLTMNEWIEPGDKSDFPVFPDLIRDQHDVLAVGNRLLTASPAGKRLANTVRTAPLLASRLDQVSRDLINKSGMTWIGSGETIAVNKLLDLQFIVDEAADELNEPELEWLREMVTVVSKVDLAMLGLKYQNKALEFRMRALIDKEQSFDKLLDLSKTERAWKPDLGLEVDQLVLAASFQMDAFRSSAAPRALPQILLRESGNADRLRFLQGNMLRVLTELAGDSWNELDAARIAVYKNDETEGAGQLAIIGVADSRDPEEVMMELRRLSQLTSPLMAGEREDMRNEEIARLISELRSDDPNLAARAETRLRLAGPDAVLALEDAAKSSHDRQRTRSEQILRRIKKSSRRNAERSVVSDPWFWTTLNPGLELTESSGTLAGFPVHTIQVTPDPSKDEAEVAEAIQVMKALVGPEWNNIRVVQARNHFVFMIGSDLPLLERIVRNVDSGDETLARQFKGVGYGPQRGQVQLFFETTRLSKLLGIRSYDVIKIKENVAADEKKVCWIGVDFDRRGVNADALIPVRQVIPFLMDFGN